MPSCFNTLLEAVRHFRSVIMDAGSRGTTAHAQQCCIFQSYAKTVPSRMKLTMREPANHDNRQGVTSYSNSVYLHSSLHKWILIAVSCHRERPGVHICHLVLSLYICGESIVLPSQNLAAFLRCNQECNWIQPWSTKISRHQIRCKRDTQHEHHQKGQSSRNYNITFVKKNCLFFVRSTAADHLLSPLFLLDLELLLECDESPVFNRLRDLCPVEFSRWSESESDPTSKPLLLEERRRPFVFPSSPRGGSLQNANCKSSIWKHSGF